MGFAQRAFVAAGVGFAVAAIAGCGSSGGRLLTASESNRLSEQLNRVTQALDEQRCSDAQQYLSQFQSTVDNLGGVNSTLISNLDQGASTIQSLANSECVTRTVTTPKKTHTRTSTSTTTAATQTTPTFTTPSTTYTTPTYTQPTYSQPSTNTTGGSGVGTDTNTGGTTSTTQSTTTSNGGTGLGSTDTSTGGTTTTYSSTGTTGGGF